MKSKICELKKVLNISQKFTSAPRANVFSSNICVLQIILQAQSAQPSLQFSLYSFKPRIKLFEQVVFWSLSQNKGLSRLQLMTIQIVLLFLCRLLLWMKLEPIENYRRFGTVACNWHYDLVLNIMEGGDRMENI